jgi:predicted MFS family arabinose efflux permease
MLNPWWERHFGRARALGITLTAAAASFLLLSVVPALALAVPVYVAATGLRNTMQPLFQPLLMDALPTHERTFASSISFVQWNIGWFAATSLSGVWQTTFGFGFIMQLVAACLLVNALMVMFIFRRGAFQPDLLAVKETMV